MAAGPPPPTPATREGHRRLDGVPWGKGGPAEGHLGPGLSSLSPGRASLWAPAGTPGHPPVARSLSVSVSLFLSSHPSLTLPAHEAEDGGAWGPGVRAVSGPPRVPRARILQPRPDLTASGPRVPGGRGLGALPLPFLAGRPGHTVCPRSPCPPTGDAAAALAREGWCKEPRMGRQGRRGHGGHTACGGVHCRGSRVPAGAGDAGGPDRTQAWPSWASGARPGSPQPVGLEDGVQRARGLLLEAGKAGQGDGHERLAS